MLLSARLMHELGRVQHVNDVVQGLARAVVVNGVVHEDAARESIVLRLVTTNSEPWESSWQGVVLMSANAKSRAGRPPP